MDEIWQCWLGLKIWSQNKKNKKIKKKNPKKRRKFFLFFFVSKSPQWHPSFITIEDRNPNR
jgi:hypothetical protein